MRALRVVIVACVAWLALAWLARPASAHLMVAQHGTVNVVGDGAYLVLSVPVTALTPLAPIDDDGDGALSMRELRAHAPEVEALVHAHVTLAAGDALLPLQGVMLSLAPPDDAPRAPSRQLVIMGRFALGSAAVAPAPPLTLGMTLFGSAPDERAVSLTATRGAEKQLVVLTPDHAQQDLFPPLLHGLASAAALGFHHVTSGLDHLLFLLVVVVAGWRVRQLVWVLSCFTLGHALTLLASTWLGASISPGIVEPAIAATIVGMALFDWATSGAARTPPARSRMALVFGCALIHGLGLAGALAGMGLGGANRVTVLLGFNAGIELAQLVLALAAVAVLAAIRRWGGEVALRRTTRIAWLLAIAIGSIWFAQRV